MALRLLCDWLLESLKPAQMNFRLRYKYALPLSGCTFKADPSYCNTHCLALLHTNQFYLFIEHDYTTKHCVCVCICQGSSSGQIEKQHVVTSGQISFETCRDHTHSHAHTNMHEHGCKLSIL